MNGFQKIAEKLKISSTVLAIILGGIGLVLIAGIVILMLFWEDLQYHQAVGKYPEGDAITVNAVFAAQDTHPLLDNGILLSKEIGSAKTELGCMDEAEDCEIALYQQANGRPISLTAMVLNERTGYPVRLSGLTLEFTGYEPYTEVNVGTPRSGSASNTPSAINDRLQLVSGGDEIIFSGVQEWLIKQSEDPTKTIGQRFFLDLSETLAESDSLLQMSADEVEFLSILLPFSDETPPGWYAFQLSILYETPEGDQYRTQPQMVNVIIPETIKLFRYTLGEQGFDGKKAFISYQPFADEIAAERLAVSPGSNYTLLLQTGNPNNKQQIATQYWKYDLMTGTPIKIHPPYSMGGVFASNDGWKQVFLMPDYEWALYDLADDSTILLDETSRFVTPVWSPNDTKLAFYHATQENTIGVFDIATEEMREIPLSITGALQDMHWLSEDTLVFMIHNGAITFFYEYSLTQKAFEVIHSLAGIDEDQFIITSQGSIVALNDEFGVTIPHLKWIYPLDYGSVGVDGWYCVWQPEEFIAFCSTGKEVYLVDQVNETTEKILEFGGLVGIESLGSSGIAVISTEDIVYLFDIFGEEQARFHIEGISEQQSFDLQYSFLVNP